MMKMKKCSGQLVFFLVSVTLFLLVVGVGVFIYNSYRQISSINVPRMEISLDGITLEKIHKNGKNIKYGGNTVILFDHGNKEVFSNVELKGRGNFSWAAEKKSYNIKLPNKVSLLGLGRQKKWGLIANSLDDTLLRNDIGHYISNTVTEEFPISGDYLELKIDEQDLGLYYLSELVSIGKESVDIKNPFGVLVEFDKVYCQDEQYNYKSETIKDCMSLKDAVDDDNIEFAMNNFMDYYNKFEKLLINGKYKEVFNYIDKESWAEYYLLSEFTGDIDASTTSWFFYKDGLENKIYSGPGWDFDAGFGNRNWGEWPDDFYSPNTIMARLKYSFDKKEDYSEGKKMGCRYETEGNEVGLSYVSPVTCYLVDIPEFVDEVSRLYKERLMNRREEILAYIRDRADYIRETAIRNNEMWGKGDFNEAVDYLVWWVDKRFDLFDELYGGKRTEFLEEPSEV